MSAWDLPVFRSSDILTTSNQSIIPSGRKKLMIKSAFMPELFCFMMQRYKKIMNCRTCLYNLWLGCLLFATELFTCAKKMDKKKCYFSVFYERIFLIFHYLFLTIFTKTHCFFVFFADLFGDMISIAYLCRHKKLTNGFLYFFIKKIIHSIVAKIPCEVNRADIKRLKKILLPEKV